MHFPVDGGGGPNRLDSLRKGISSEAEVVHRGPQAAMASE